MKRVKTDSPGSTPEKRVTVLFLLSSANIYSTAREMPNIVTFKLIENKIF